MTTPTWLIAGCMSGTSLDAVDAALCRITRQESWRAEVVATSTVELGAGAGSLRRLASGEPMAAGEIAAAAADLAERHIACLRPLLAGRVPDLIVSHGQTVFHAPPRSWQLLNPFPIAAAFGAPVLSDLRQGDLVLGGQGAPITPLADAVLYAGVGEGAAIVNLGGFCNITTLGAEVRGRDVCACNQVLDGVARRWLGRAFDEGGRAAAGAAADPALVAALDVWLERQREAGRSLGSGDELAAWVEGCEETDAARVCASACAAVGRCIGRAVGEAPVVVLAGGGVRNEALVRAIRGACAGRVVMSDEVGVPAAYREAAGMAVLGALALAGEATTAPGVTGRRPGSVIAGSWTGRGG